MSEKLQRTAYVLSIFVAVFALAASAGGLFIPGLYRDNPFVLAAWRGNDLVTLAVATPVLVISLFLASRGSGRAQLVWLGMLDYTLYNYAFYLFAAAFNWFFLLYVSLFTLSIFALLFGLLRVDVSRISQQFTGNLPVKWVAGYMAFVAFGLTSIYLFQAFSFIATDEIPAIVLKTGHPTSVVPALDMSLVIPWLILGAVWLWQRRPWGYIIAAIISVKGAVYMLALTLVSLSAMSAGFPEAAAECPLWGFLSVGFLTASFLFLLGNMGPVRSSGQGVG
jgi:hypothetical protein